MAFALFQFRNDVLIIHEHGNGSNGDAEENSHHAEDTAAHDDGNENQEGLVGEYHYTLRQNGIRVAAGLAIIGEPSRIPEAAAGSVENISIKQYGEN